MAYKKKRYYLNTSSLLLDIFTSFLPELVPCSRYFNILTMGSSSYRWIIYFCALSIIGLALLPNLPLYLAPTSEGQSFAVSYNWEGASPEAVERQITIHFEGLFSTMKGVKKIQSKSSYNQGYVTVEMDENIDMDAARLEIAALVRQLYPHLPIQMTYPQINLNKPDNIDQTNSTLLLTFQLSGPNSSESLQNFAEDQIKPYLGSIEGIKNITIYGSERAQWDLIYNEDQLNNLQIDKNALLVAIREHFRRESLGFDYSQNGNVSRVSLDNLSKNKLNLWDSIPVISRSGRIIFLTDLVKITKKIPLAQKYYKINGKTAINIVLNSASNANQLILSQKIITKIHSLHLPKGFALGIEYDATKYIRENLLQISVQSGAAITILLIFIALTTQSLHYVIIIVTSTIITLLVSVIIFTILKTEFHLYSLAALTTSFGIVMDNTIVMIDHYKRKRDVSVFSAMLGGTLTTCAGLVVVWFLPEENKRAFTDFSIVMVVTLMISLVVSACFVPAIIEQFKKNNLNKLVKIKITQIKRNRKQIVFYKKIILLFLRFKFTLVVIAILSFGIPIFLLPIKMDINKPFASMYNATFGSEWYIENLRIHINKWFGGTLRLFVNYVSEGSYQTNQERSSLYVIAELPNQSTPQQMELVFKIFEDNIKNFYGIDKYITQIYNGQQGSLIVYFKPGLDRGMVPYKLRNLLIFLCTQTSGINWNVFGIGEGYNQSFNESESSTFNVEMLGYNFKELDKQVKLLQKMLEGHTRIRNVNINRIPGLFQHKSLQEYTLSNNQQALALIGVNSSLLYSSLANYNVKPIPDQYFLSNGNYEAINVRPIQSQSIDIWQLKNRHISIGNFKLKLNDVSTFLFKPILPEIYKVDQEYRRLISFEYYGNYIFGNKYLSETLTNLKTKLPTGYSAKAVDRFWHSNNTETPYKLLGIIILIIYIICAILFESLWQPFALISLIPLSYIGIFTAFYLTGANFDQGGYTSFILLAGNVVYAGIFIISEMNKIKKQFPKLSITNVYLKAFRYKISTILMTVLSTIFGMIPFIIFKNEPFWFSFGIGTVGGLLISLLAIFIYLPIFLLKTDKNHNNV